LAKFTKLQQQATKESISTKRKTKSHSLVKKK